MQGDLAVLAVTGHRPWPLPAGRFLMRQTWSDVLFLHWRVPAASLEPRLPARLELDAFDGSAWLGAIPFRMRLGGRRLLELNLRTYVARAGKPGVFFFRLDVTSRLVAIAARLSYHLPYRFARASVEGELGELRYRFASPGGDVRFVATARPAGVAAPPASGTLEHWLTERYCLYVASRRGRLLRGDIHHHPWPLQPVEARVEESSFAAALGFDLGSQPDHACYSPGVTALVWALRESDAVAPSSALR